MFLSRFKLNYGPWFGLCLLLGSGLFSLGCGHSGGTSNLLPPVVNNTLPITVNAGPAGNYADGAFTSVTVCVPKTTNCQVIHGVLVDTGSVGLRLLASALTVNLSNQTSGSATVGECLPFSSFYTWGPVANADVKLAGETASNLPIQIINASGFAAAPSGCTSQGLSAVNTVNDLGANGILGVGIYNHDCGSGCTATTNNPNLYYACTSSSCTAMNQPLANQVQNPVSLFAHDNNGVIISLPSISASGALTASGSLIFGIGTQADNGLGSATVFATNSSGNINVSYKGTKYSNSYIDSGSNGYFFLDSTTTGLPACSKNTGFYCPTNPATFSVTLAGSNASTGNLSFSIDNADALFGSSDTAYNDLGGPNPNSFDFGLAFFFGRNVYTAINGANTPGGVGPYWAY